MEPQDGLIVLVPYEGGQEYWGETAAFLPVFVATQDEDLALMAVAYEACVDYSYVAFPLSETAEVWQERDYPGTLRSPGVELPPTEAAYEIPEPGDCFCCGGLYEFEVLSPEAMIERLQTSPNDFMLEGLIGSEGEDASLWQQFDHWIKKYLGEISIPEADEELSMSEAIERLKDGMDQLNDLVEGILESLPEQERNSRKSKTLQQKGEKLQDQLGDWLDQVIDYVSEYSETSVAQDWEQTQPGEMTLAEVIHSLKGEILGALDRGYSFADIAATLTEQGIEVDASTLRDYMSK